MNRILSSAWFFTHICMKKFGKLNSALFLLILASVFFHFSFDYMARDYLRGSQAQLENLKKSNLLHSQSAANIVVPSEKSALELFEQNLAEKRYVEQEIKKILAIAEKNALTIKMGEYKNSENLQGNFSIYQMQLPVRASYSKLRIFLESVLLELPYVSLDEINFKRESINQDQFESKIKFSIYTKASALNSPSKSFE